jgi:hypothetical protein
MLFSQDKIIEEKEKQNGSEKNTATKSQTPEKPQVIETFGQTSKIISGVPQIQPYGIDVVAKLADINQIY